MLLCLLSGLEGLALVRGDRILRHDPGRVLDITTELKDMTEVEDITERKRSEELLRQQSAALTDSMDGVAILDESGTYAYLNDAHAEIFGYDDPEELIGKSWKVLYDEIRAASCPPSPKQSLQRTLSENKSLDVRRQCTPKVVVTYT